MADLYDADTYTWAIRQADALRRRSANELDWDNIAEEIESVGKTEAKELESRLTVLLAHLLKWRRQSDRRSASWEVTIAEQRRKIRRHLEQNPGLKSRQSELFTEAYTSARAEAMLETGLPLATFPLEPEIDLVTALDDAYWPEP